MISVNSVVDSVVSDCWLDCSEVPVVSLILSVV